MDAHSSSKDSVSLASIDDTDSDDTSSRSSFSSSRPLKSPFRFNNELDLVWLRCVHLAASVIGQTVHPVHIALCLLFEGLRSDVDPRLKGITENHYGKVLERPLFWSVISKLSSPRQAESLDEHILGSSETAVGPSKPMPVVLGQALYEKVKGLEERDLLPPNVDYDVNGVSILSPPEVYPYLKLFRHHSNLHVRPPTPYCSRPKK